MGGRQSYKLLTGVRFPHRLPHSGTVRREGLRKPSRVAVVLMAAQETVTLLVPVRFRAVSLGSLSDRWVMVARLLREQVCGGSSPPGPTNLHPAFAKATVASQPSPPRRVSFGRSSNGKMAGSEPADRGSNSRLPASFRLIVYVVGGVAMTTRPAVNQKIRVRCPFPQPISSPA